MLKKIRSYCARLLLTLLAVAATNTYAEKGRQVYLNYFEAHGVIYIQFVNKTRKTLKCEILDGDEVIDDAIVYPLSASLFIEEPEIDYDWDCKEIQRKKR